jgi:hypothetical protein
LEDTNNKTVASTPSNAGMVTNEPKIDPVKYVYDDIKQQADKKLSNLDTLDQKNQKQDFFSGLFQESAPAPKLSFEESRIDIDEAYTKLSDNTYITRYDEGFTKGMDNEQAYAEKQGSGSKWLNGLGKFIGKTGVNIVGGTLGTAWGAIEAIGTGNWEAVYDNSFYDMLDDQNTKMDTFAANYRTQKERDMGFGGSMLTANFWADDFLGGMSFMAGTVVSESLWAAATGGASLATSGARVGLRAGQFFKTAAGLTKGLKNASKVYRSHATQLSAINKGIALGRTGAAVNTLRFAYTSAGYEAGMEARLFQKEQKDEFYSSFESKNGRKPNPSDIADFETNLSSTTNVVFATNLALVGTSNLAILGKTFGVKSPFSGSGSKLNKAIFGGGTKTTVGKGGQITAVEAVAKNKLQRSLGFAKGLLKDPIYEGVIEEGGQAVTTSAAEAFIESRYNVNKDSVEIIEAIYDGLSHTYGTKEGWKEVGLGMLIGFFGGQGTNLASGQGFLTEARDAFKETSQKDQDEADLRTKTRGELVAKSIIAQKLDETFKNSSELLYLQSEVDAAERKGDAMGVDISEKGMLLHGVKAAVKGDYLEDQLADFKTAMELQKDDIAERYGIEVKEDSAGNKDYSEVDTRIESLLEDSRALAKVYKRAEIFASYAFSDNPKETDENDQPINISYYREALATQIVMTEQIENSMQGAHEALTSLTSKLNPKIREQVTAALNRHKQLKMSRNSVVKNLQKASSRVGKKKEQLAKLEARLIALDVKSAGSQTDQSKSNQSAQYTEIFNKKTELENDLAQLNEQVETLEGQLHTTKDGLTVQQKAQKAMDSVMTDGALNLVDPLVDGTTQQTMEQTQKGLETLEDTLESMKETDPELRAQIKSLLFEYEKGLAYWKRSSDTLGKLSDPETGLGRMKSMFQRNKKASQSTLEMLEGLQKTALQEDTLNTLQESSVTTKDPDDAEKEEDTKDPDKAKKPTKKKNNNKKEEEDPGKDITETTEQEELDAVDEMYDPMIEEARNTKVGEEGTVGSTTTKVKVSDLKEGDKFTYKGKTYTVKSLNQDFNTGTGKVINNIETEEGPTITNPNSIQVLKSAWSLDKVDSASNRSDEQRVKELRAEEQTELKRMFPNAELNSDGKINLNKLSKEDKEAHDKVYDAYDKLISPLLKNIEASNQSGIKNASQQAEEEISQERARLSELEKILEEEFNNLTEEIADANAPDFSNDTGGVLKAVDFDGSLENRKSLVNAMGAIGKVSKKQSDFFGKERIEEIKRLAKEAKALSSKLSPAKTKNRRAAANAETIAENARKTQQKIEDNKRAVEALIKEKEEAKKQVVLKYGNTKLQEKIKEIKDQLDKIINTSAFAMENISTDSDTIVNGKKPTQEDIDKYQELVEAKDTFSKEFKDLAQKMLEWRIVDNTSLDGTSIKNLLDLLEIYQKEIGENEIQITSRQTLEVAQKSSRKYSMEQKDPDYVQTMSKVNVKRTEDDLQISHLDMDTVAGKFQVQIGAKKDGVQYYEITGQGGYKATIKREDNGHRIIIPQDSVEGFLEGMGIAMYDATRKQWSSWGFAFELQEDGIYRPMKSDMDITLTGQGGELISILNPQAIYELQEGEKVSFQVNINDSYNREKLPEMSEEEARNMLSIYVVNKKGEVLGYLKAGYEGQIDSNASKVRDMAFEMYRERVKAGATTANTVLQIPYETTVKSFFIGMPNIELDSNSNPLVYDVTEKQSALVVGFGTHDGGKTSYAENSEQQDDKEVDKRFLPSDKKSAFIIIKHGSKKVAFPVSMKETEGNLMEKVAEVLDSNESAVTKELQLVSLLRGKVGETAGLNIRGIIENGIESDPELKELIDNSTSTMSKEDVAISSKLGFTSSIEIPMNLDKPAFVSPKLKLGLSQGITDLETNKKYQSKKPSEKQKKDFISDNLAYLSEAKTEEEVFQLMANTANDSMIKEFEENKDFRDTVIKAAINTESVPLITLQESEEENLKKTLEVDDQNEEDPEEVKTLKRNPSEDNLKKAAQKTRTTSKNKRVVLPKKIDPQSTYYIDTKNSDQNMLEKGFVRIADKFYKKVVKKTKSELLEGLYAKYMTGAKLNKMQLENGMSFEEFKEALPKTLLGIYKAYYNTPKTNRRKTYAINTQGLGNIQYIKEQFPAEFEKLRAENERLNTPLYKEVLSKFYMAEGSIRAMEELTEENLGMLEQQLPDIHRALMEYSIINKNIDLWQNAESVIFEYTEQAERLEGVNNPKIIESAPKEEGKDSVVYDKKDTLGKPFIEYKGSIYENVKEEVGKVTYQKIAEVDSEFVITDVAPPFTQLTDKEDNDRQRTESPPKTPKTGGIDPIICS